MNTAAVKTQMPTYNEYEVEREKRYILGDTPIMIERLKEGYLQIMNTAEIAREYGYISPKFMAVVSELMQDVYFKFKERLEAEKMTTNTIKL